MPNYIARARKGISMDIYKNDNIANLLKDNSYPGRGIVLGKTKDGENACTAYFIMGRSANSRNRILQMQQEVLYTKPFDESKVEDPSLIIYAAMRTYQNKLMVTNGDQTDTIYEKIQQGKSFSEALRSREFEPDAPNFTPRISGMITFEKEDFSYEMSILKSADAQGSACSRYTFSYKALAGTGHFLHTYECDGNPIPTFQGEPRRIEIGNEIEAFAKTIWHALDTENKIALYVQYKNLKTGKVQSQLLNKNQ